MEQHRAKLATPASWRPGVSGNPRGRPPKGSALTEAIRARVDVNELVAIALELARDGKQESTRIAALTWLQTAGFTRPADKLEVAHAELDRDEDVIDYDALTVDQLRELAELDDRRRAILALPAGPTTTVGSAGMQPDGIDDNPKQSSAVIDTVATERVLQRRDLKELLR